MTDSLQPFTFQLSADTNPAIRDILLTRGCTPYNPYIHSHCSLHWTTKQYTIPPDTHSATHVLNGSNALFNHFPHTVNVTQKDALARTMRRLRAVYGTQLYSFTPLSFILATRKSQVVRGGQKRSRGEEERRQQEEDEAVGAAAVDSEAQPEQSRPQHHHSSPTPPPTSSAAIPAVCQRYIGRPHLIGGHKYDLRIYVLVTSLSAAACLPVSTGLVSLQLGTQYTPLDPSNLLAHLTNSSLHQPSTPLPMILTIPPLNSSTSGHSTHYLAHTHSSPPRRTTHLLADASPTSSY